MDDNNSILQQNENSRQSTTVYSEKTNLLDDNFGFENKFDIEEADDTLEEVEEEFNEEKTKDVHTLKPIQTFGLLINFIMGTGVFGLPFAFEAAGIGLSVLTILFFFVISVITAMWVLENMGRSSGVMETYRKSRNAEKPENEIEFEVYNYSRMSAIFFGKGGKFASIIFMSMFCYGALWAYSSVFSSSVTLILWKYPFQSFGECSNTMSDWEIFGNCHLTYLGGIVLFALIVVPLSMMGVTEQAVLQTILTIWRFVCFGIMIITCLIDIFYRVAHDNFVAIPEGTSTGTFLFNMKGFSILFGSCSVALACHQNLPDVVTPTKPKKHLRSLVISGISTATVLYLLIGIGCSLCFGTATKTPVTHNWLNFTGCKGGFGECDDGKSTWIGVLMQWLILLFPAINLASEFPLVCVTLSSNLLQLIPKKIKDKHPKLWVYIMRVAACAPPIIAGAIKGDLDVIFNFAGIFGFFLLFIIPGVLQIYSKYIIRRKWGSKTYVTKYSGKYSTSYLAWPILIIAIICFSFSLAQFLVDLFDF